MLNEFNRIKRHRKLLASRRTKVFREYSRPPGAPQPPPQRMDENLVEIKEETDDNPSGVRISPFQVGRTTSLTPDLHGDAASTTLHWRSCTQNSVRVAGLEPNRKTVVTSRVTKTLNIRSVVVPGATECKLFAAAAESRLSRIPSHLLNTAKTVLSWATVMEEPITKSELAEVLILKENPTSSHIPASVLEEIGEDIVSVCSGLISFDVSSGHLRWSHPAIPHYINGDNSRFAISLGDAHEEVSKTCWNYLSKGNLRRDLSSRSMPRQSIVRYIIRHCLTHTHLAETRGRLMLEDMMEFFKTDIDTFRIWAKEYSSVSGKMIADPRLHDPLLFSARFGFYKLAKLALRSGNAAPGQRERAFKIASENRHSDIAFLLQCG